MNTSRDVLKTTFGYDSFREGQKEIIDSMVSGTDALGIMPTGSGKSICYQIPALMKEGITIVISPLVSLMQDQVRQLVALNIKGAYINSSLTSNQIKLALQNLKNNHYKIVYVAPERLMSYEFTHAIKDLNIDFVVIDEAHCISKWGHDFRPSYRSIPAFIDSFKARPTVAGFTATANRRTKDDIILNLELDQPLFIENSFDRPNIYFDIMPSTKRRNNLLSIIKTNQESTIVYCNTRKSTESVTKFLQKNGIKTSMYHAGMSSIERTESQKKFTFDEVMVIVATNAFGMGINKPDVRHVIHYNIPKDIESYYQEVGRAGRDGLPATGLLFYSRADVFMNQRILSYNEDSVSSEEDKHRFKSLEQMNAFAVSSECLRNTLLSYFGEERSEPCGNCINCKTSFKSENIGAEASVIIDYIKELGQKGWELGKARISKVLVEDDKQEDPIDSNLAGKLKDKSVNKINTIIDYLIDHQYLSVDSLNYYVISLGDRSIKDFESFEMKTRASQSRPSLKTMARTHYPSLDSLENPVNEDLFEALRQYRKDKASNDKVPMYVIFNNVTLNELVQKMPSNNSELLNVTGIGPVKLEKYGSDLLEILSNNAVSINQSSTSETISMEDLRERHPKAYARWTAEEEESVKKAYNDGHDVEKIAKAHNRTARAIHMRLVQLGLIEE